jgi:GT2 family glycosyltransferase
VNERHVTAVVLLSGTTTAATHDALQAALTAQTRRPDRVVAVAPSDLDPQVQGALQRAASAGEVDRLLDVPAQISRAGAVQAVLEQLAAQHERSLDPVGAPRAADEAPAAARTSRRSGRRARSVDTGAVERERTQRAEDLARVPERLRVESYRSGRRAGLAEGAEDERWLWFLEDPEIPSLDALEQELAMVEQSPSTAVVGTKRVRHAEADADLPLTAESGDALVDVGLTLTHGGRIISGVDPGEIDQGQADWRQDVLAVPLPAMLIREQTLRELDGLDPDLPAPWAEIDLCQRVWRSGERVAVQSSARVLHPHPSRPLTERLRDQRTGRILVVLKHRPLLHALLTLLLLPLETLLRMGAALAATEPRMAAMELRAVLAALPSLRAVLSRGVRDRRRARVPRRRLAPLYLPRGASLRRWIDDVGTRLFADDDRRRRIRRTTWGVAGTRHGLDDADYGRHIVWTAVVVLGAAVLSLVTLRGLFGRGELVGPALRAVPDSMADRWAAAWSSWIPGGLGERGPGDALVRLLGHLPVSGSLLVEALVLAAVPAAAVAAWWASGAITRAVGARLVLTAVWALAPSLVSALAVGAWPLLAVHVLLPLLALAVGRAIGLPHKVSQASVSAAAAGGLLLLLIGAVQPVLVLLAALVLALVALAVPGRRRRLLWVLLPSLALHAPYLPTYLGHPRTLLAVAGAPAAPGTAGPWELLGLWPVDPGLVGSLPAGLDGTAAQLLLLLPVAPVVLGALVSPLLAAAAGRVGRLSLLGAAAAALAVLLARGTPTAVGQEQLLTPPLHALLSAALLCFALGAAATFDALARREARDSRIRRLLTSVIGVAIAAACLVTVAGGVLLLPGALQVQRSTSGEVPAAAADQGRTEARQRVLVLSQAEDGSVQARLVVGGGDSVLQHAALADARDVAVVLAGDPADADPASTALREEVAAMLAGGAGAAGGDAGEEALAHPAISYVVVQGDLEAQSGLMGTLDGSPLLEKVTEGTTGGMWRVVDTAPRAVVVGGQDEIPLASGIIDAHGTLDAAGAERTVVLSERHDTDWRATLDGTELAAIEVDGWAQGFTVPAGAEGELEIHREQPARLLWQLLLYGTTATTALIAIPWRIRTRTAEEMYG